jgi:hypothetical protein
MSHRLHRAAILYPVILFGAFASIEAPSAWCADSVQARVNAGFQIALSGTVSGSSCAASYKVPGGKRLHIDYIGYNVMSSGAYYLYGGTITVTSPQFTTYFTTAPPAFSSATVWQGGQLTDAVADAGATVSISIDFYRADSSATCSFGISGQLVDSQSAQDGRQVADRDARR